MVVVMLQIGALLTSEKRQTIVTRANIIQTQSCRYNTKKRINAFHNLDVLFSYVL